MSKPSEPFPAGRSNRWRALIGLFLLGAFLLLLAVFLVYRFSGAAATGHLEAALRQRGEPATLADIEAALPRVADQDNGALLLLQLWEKDSPEYWKAFREQAQTLPERPSATYDPALPFFGPGAEHVLRTAALDSTNIAAAQSWLAQKNEHIDAVRLALRKEQFRFPLQITNGVFMLLPHLAELKREATTFSLVGLMALERGDANAAIEAMEDIARIGHALSAEPLLISQLVRIASYGRVLDDMERLLSRRPATPEQLDRLKALLDRLDMGSALRAALMTERAQGLEVIKLPPEMLMRMDRPSDSDEEGMSPAVAHLATSFLSVSGLKDADRRFMLKTMEEAIALAGRDDPDSLRRFRQIFEEVRTTSFNFPPKLVSSMLLPALDKAGVKFAQFEARRRAAFVALEVERYRMTHEGRLPEQLEDLAAQFPSGIPKDPFDGQPLRFRPLATGFVIYSIGANEADDGGKERQRRGSNKDTDETFIIERP